MTSIRMSAAGRVSRPARRLSSLNGVAAALALTAAPFAWALPAEAAAQAAPIASAGHAITDFYRARSARPLWLAPESGRAAQLLVEQLAASRADGLGRDRYNSRLLDRAVRAARSGDYRAVQRAEQMLSQALVAFARDLRREADPTIIYVDAELRPTALRPRELLEAAAQAPSLEQWVTDMGWMHPTYAQLRRALLDGAYRSDSERRLIEINLDRARALPHALQRHVLVNAAAQRLFVYENGQVVDTMRVVVGQPKHATPMMNALIRFATLNPYWNVPPDLAAERVAPNVVKEGLGYLRRKRYQVLSDWSDSPSIVDPSTIDWQAVADGRIEIRVRQLPGPANSMGKMKFMFPNAQGIYLHDTPDDELFSEASRLFSGGCVRLEDAARLGQWLFGRPLRPSGAEPEQQVPLETPVPVYLTYLTAVPSGSSLAFFDDIYGRDAARLAQLSGGVVALPR